MDRLETTVMWRRSGILFGLCRLHIRYLRFESAMLRTLPEGLHRPIGQLESEDLAFANLWNHRLSGVLRRLHAPYARCMKRALVMAMMLGHREDISLVIGVTPDNPADGHAWLEADGEVLLESFTRQSSPYVEISRLPVARYGETQ